MSFPAAASGAEPAAAQQPSPFPSGPYCGIYCLQRALRAVGHEVEIETLIEPKYVGSPEGSSIAELTRAAEDAGAAAVPLSGLTTDALHSSNHPILLHVAGSAMSNVHNHWVLFLGVEEGQAKIYDPPNTVALISFARLLSISDGMGLVVQPADARVAGFWLAGWSWRSMGIVLFGLAMVVVHHGLARPGAAPSLRVSSRRRFASLLGKAALLAVVGISVGFVHDLTSANGILRNPAAVAGVANKFYPECVHQVEIGRVRELVTGKGIVVDSRMERAYAVGHIPGAINVPVTGGLFGHRALLNKPANATPIVIYCQNEQCLWARDVAFRLLADGYEDVSVFSGGWEAWSQAEDSHE